MYIKKSIIVAFCIASNLCIFAFTMYGTGALPKSVSEALGGNTFVFHIDNSAQNHAAVAASKKEQRPCGALWGRDLTECFLLLDDKTRKEMLTKLPMHKRKSFIHNLTFEEYRCWISSYTQSEWNQFAALFYVGGNKKLKGVQEQREMLHKIECDAFYAMVKAEMGLVALNLLIPGINIFYVPFQCAYIAKYRNHFFADQYREHHFKEFIKRMYE